MTLGSEFNDQIVRPWDQCGQELAGTAALLSVRKDKLQTSLCPERWLQTPIVFQGKLS